MRGRNFLLTILNLLKGNREELKVVDDQVGAPTWCRMVAEATSQMVARGSSLFGEKSGIYHLSSGGQTSWCGFAAEIMRNAVAFMPHTTRLHAILSSQYVTAARRPANSVLSNARINATFGVMLPAWEHGLTLALSAAFCNYDDV
jgi:dTDP-4-dehydrorhamnose reductase